MNIAHRHRHFRAFARAVVAASLALGVPGTVIAASSWSPTLLVNTESFQTIDSGDGTTNRELRFGDTSQERLIYDVNRQRFNFTRSLNVSGNITATGSISAVGTVSGAYVKAVSGLSSSGTLTFEGAGSGSSLTLAGGNVSIAANGAAVFNEFGEDRDFRIEGASDTNLVFVDAGTDRLGVGTATPDTKLEVVGTVSGSQIHATDTLSSSGTLVFEGAASGSSLYLGTSLRGAGLTSCNGSNDKLVWDAATGRFACATDNTAASGMGYADAEGIFVNQAGDTMTGGLVIDLTSGSLGLNVRQTMSGNTLRVSNNAAIHGPLAVTGAIRTDSNITINDDQTAADAVLTFGNDGGNETLTFSDTFNEFELSDDLRVTGNLSTSGAFVFEGAASGSSLYLGTSLQGAGLTDCDGEDQTLLWNSATGRFSCGVDNGGSFGTGNVLTIGDSRYVNVSGDTMTGALTIDVAGEGSTALSVSGTLIFNDAGLDNDARFEGATDANLFFLDASTDRIGIGTATPKAKLDVVGSISGSSLTVNGAANVRGALSASGNIRTEGNLSGSTLTVDGNVTLRGQTYSFPVSQTTSGFLQTDGAGNLSWTTSLGNGSGDTLSLHPEYPNAVYFASGSTSVGQLTLSGGTTALDNSYVWTSTNASIQDYWISVREKVPDNFTSWDPVSAMQLRYKTGANSPATNHLTVRIKDTAGADVTGTGGLFNTSWTTANIPGPAQSGTWTPGGYFTVYVKVASNNSGNAAAGFLNFNWETTK